MQYVALQNEPAEPIYSHFPQIEFSRRYQHKSNTNYTRQMQQNGLNIARYRKLRGLTQEELAALISMSRTHLSNLEAPGKITSISLEKLFTIADVLNVSPASLLSFD